MQSWAEYVREVARGDRQTDISERTGIDQTTISRWLNGEMRAVTPRSVTRFAQGYNRKVLEAFVVAGLISESDARARVTVPAGLGMYDDASLISELARRHEQAAS